MLGTPHTEPSDYELFGLRLRSDIALPELFPAPREDAPDVVIRVGELGEPPAQPGLTATEDALLLTVAGVGRYRIRGGEEIVVDATPGVPERNVRLYLLGSAMGALLHQRGLLPLHANAIEIDGQAVAFMGESGAGKSTVAAWFHDRGFRVIADDVCVVKFDGDERALACPGLPRLRLWEEALEATGRPVAEYPRSYLGDDDFRKYDVSISANAARKACAIGAVFVLARSDDVVVDRLSGIEAIQAVFDNTYRGSYLGRVNGHRAHWSAAVRLIRNVPLYRLARVWRLDRLDEQCERILARVRDSARV
ncbi:MAG TPA: hypothetical protein VJT70_08205 [Sphingomicrobium sp.]|nr:hypothetical protein [Sphingomicrobium sp.]